MVRKSFPECVQGSKLSSEGQEDVARWGREGKEE